MVYRLHDKTRGMLVENLASLNISPSGMDVTKTGNGEWGMGNGEWEMGN